MPRKRLQLGSKADRDEHHEHLPDVARATAAAALASGVRMEAERGRHARSSFVLVPMGEPPSSGSFLNQTVLVSGGGSVIGHALIGRILREGGSVIAVRAAVLCARLHAWRRSHGAPADAAATPHAAGAHGALRGEAAPHAA